MPSTSIQQVSLGRRLHRSPLGSRVIAAELGLLDVIAVDGALATAASTAVPDSAGVGTDLTTPAPAISTSPDAVAAGDTIQWIPSYPVEPGTLIKERRCIR